MTDLNAQMRHLGHETLAPFLGQQDAWRQAWQACADAGVLGLVLPAELGGGGQSFEAAVGALQTLGQNCPDNGLLLGLGAQIWSMQMPILEFGTHVQKSEILPKLTRGELICSHAVTEAATGSDAMALQTTAQETDEGFILNGEKTYIGMAPVCDLALVFATTNADHGTWGVCAFLVDATQDGIERGPKVEKMGTTTLPFGSIRFDNCRVPKSALLGKKGGGAAIFNRSLDWERRFIFAGHVGAMARQLEDCVRRAKTRHTFGTSLDQHQSVSNRLANMRLRYETSKLLLEKAATEIDAGTPDEMTGPLTKLHISEAHLANSMDAMRLFGAEGYLAGSPVETEMRDALAGVTYGGTSDIQRNIISTLQSRRIVV